MIGPVALNARGVAAWCAALLGLAIPLSTAADGVLTAVIVLAWLLALAVSPREWRRALPPTPPALVALLLFGILVVGCFHGAAPPRPAWSSLTKYLDLALIPLFVWAAASDAVRRRAFYLFLAGVAANLIVSYAAANALFDPVSWLHSQPHYPVGFKLSVTHGILVALGAYCCLLLAREATSSGTRLAWAGLALLCAHNVLFVVIGRTGYVVLATLIVYFALSSMRGWRGVALTVVIAAGLFTAAYYGSGLKERAHEVMSDLTRWKPGAGDETSVGQRVGYYRTTLGIIAEHPLAGVGTGGFVQAYAEKVKGTDAPATTNPHNDYLMIGAQVGVPGLLLLIALYAVIWRTAKNLPSRLERDLARGVVVTMALAGMFNTMLLDHTEGLLFAWSTALLYATPKGGARLRLGPGRPRTEGNQ